MTGYKQDQFRYTLSQLVLFVGISGHICLFPFSVYSDGCICPAVHFILGGFLHLHSVAGCKAKLQGSSSSEWTSIRLLI